MWKQYKGKLGESRSLDESKVSADATWNVKAERVDKAYKSNSLGACIYKLLLPGPHSH